MWLCSVIPAVSQVWSADASHAATRFGSGIGVSLGQVPVEFKDSSISQPDVSEAGPQAVEDDWSVAGSLLFIR
jgi:hypothetical protein